MVSTRVVSLVRILLVQCWRSVLICLFEWGAERCPKASLVPNDDRVPKEPSCQNGGGVPKASLALNDDGVPKASLVSKQWRGTEGIVRVEWWWGAEGISCARTTKACITSLGPYTFILPKGAE
ncbi:hypothetical protein L3X38_041649 [Prunus dulcis]|uniref:Secreted protein n=1 Tax=Prunus dulcis TaxID=3755 RepID=A0AAD4UUR5_PRUDU|nr:hypothetical protein L3X38_041649 [Prunus dulcis]